MKTIMISVFVVMLGGFAVGYADDKLYEVTYNVDSFCKDNVNDEVCSRDLWDKLRLELKQEQKKSFMCSGTEENSADVGWFCLNLPPSSIVTQEFLDSGKKTTVVSSSDRDKLTVETENMTEINLKTDPYKIKYNMDICSIHHYYSTVLCNQSYLWEKVRSEIKEKQDSFTCDGPSQGITGVIFYLCSMKSISDDVKFTQILNSQKTTVHFYSDSGNRKINLSVEDESWKTRIYKKWQKILGE